MDSGPVTILVERRPYVPVKINGYGPLSFLLDTGSQSHNLSDDLIVHLNLRPDDRNVVQIEELEIGKAKFSRLPMPLRDNARVNELSGRRVDGFIGNHFLSTLAISIDYPSRQLRLADRTPGLCERPVEMRVCHGFPLLPVTILDSGPFWFLWDTGASRTIIAKDVADSVGLALGEAAEARGAVDSKPVRRSTVEKLSVGQIHRNDLQVDVMDCAHVSEYAQTDVHGYIGHNFLESVRLSADFPGRRFFVS